jgi:hypothetical protein
MAITQQSYINDNPKVKAARKKLSAAKANLESLERAKGQAGPGKALNKDLESRISEAKKSISAAQTEVNQIETKAKTYFDENSEAIQSKAASKEKAKKESNTASGQAQIDAMRRAGIDTTEAERLIQKRNQSAETPSANAGGDDPVGGNTGLTVEEANKRLDSFIKESQQFVFDLNDPGARSTLAQTLKDADYYSGPIIDTYTPDLALAYKSFLLGAKSYNNINKNIAGFTPLLVDDFLAYKTAIKKAGGGDGLGPDIYTPGSEKSSVTTAAKIINDEIKAATGRDATPEEIKALTPILQKIEDANPQTRSGKRGGKYTYAGGIDSAEIMRQLINDPKNATFGALDKKSAASIIKAVGKLGLADIAGQRKTDKFQISLDDIKKTAQANGLPLNDVQLQKYQDRLRAGETVDAIKKSIRSIVAGTMPDNVKKLLDAGNDLDDVYSPYKTAMSSILEVPYDKIDLNDPTLTSAITAQGNMPLYEYKNALRKDPRWQYTDNARQTVSSGLTQVLKDFGFMG